MKRFRFIFLQINGLFPFLLPLAHIFTGFHFFRGIFAYMRDYGTYKKMDQKLKSPFPLKFFQTYPMYFDRYDKAGEVPRHYFYQDLWAAQKVYRSKVKVHYDIGSRVDSFISHCLVFCKVIMLDIRPLSYKIKNLEFIQADCMNMSNIKSNSIQSISTLHVFEHFGLGRYGDPIDPLGYQKAIKELVRVTKKGGNIYFGTPIGKQRLEFNAHRVFNPLYIVKLFKGCKLIDFSAVDDNNNFVEKAKPKDFVKSDFSCGLFHFRKL